MDEVTNEFNLLRFEGTILKILLNERDSVSLSTFPTNICLGVLFEATSRYLGVLYHVVSMPKQSNVNIVISFSSMY